LRKEGNKMAYGSVNVPGARMATLGQDGKLEAAQRPSLADIQGGSNRNLIINGDFRNPVNRNGKTEYSAGLTIDCWCCDGALTIHDGYISNASNLYQMAYSQDIPMLMGKQITVSALFSDGTLETGTGVVPTSFPEVTAGYGITEHLGIALYPDGRMQIFRYSGASTGIVAVKTELGSQQTLVRQNAVGEWELIDPPDYDLQYALCSQYSPSTGEFVGSQHSNPHIEDNGYFADPINQRNKTEYTEAGYTIDRWLIYASHSITILNDAIRIKAITELTSNVQGFYQKLENALSDDAVFTLSILYRSIIKGSVANLRVRDESGLLLASTKITNTDGAVNLLSETAKGKAKDIYAANFTTYQEGDYIDIIAVKFELGPVQTLAHKEGDTWVLNDPPPNKAVELAKCQRYFERIYIHAAFIMHGVATDLLSGDIFFHTIKRAIPTITASPMYVVKRPNNEGVYGAQITKVPKIATPPSISGCNIFFEDRQVNAVDIGAPAYIGAAGAYIDVDANL